MKKQQFYITVKVCCLVCTYCSHCVCPHTWFDLHCAPASAALSLTVSYSQGEAVLPLHQVSQKQHCLVVRVVQYFLLKERIKKNVLRVKMFIICNHFLFLRMFDVCLTPAAGLLSSLVHR